MDNIKINGEFIEVTPLIKISDYLSSLANEKANLENRLVVVNDKIQQLKDAGVAINIEEKFISA